jgi:serine phosphatase RsbU (regulator of sigma subunit)
MHKLLGTDGSRFYSWELKIGKHLLGRHKDCDLVVSDSTVSRQHAEIEVSDFEEECYLTDLGSHNGTYVNGERIHGRMIVRRGDRLLFGHAEFRLGAGGDDSQTSSFGTAGEGRPTTRLAERDPEKSVYIPITEALKTLPSKVTDLPDVLPTLFEMAKQLVLPEPREVMLDRSLALVSKVIPAERLAVLFTSEESGEVYTGALLLNEGKDPGSFTLSRTIVNDILTNKNAIVVGDPETDPRFSGQESIIISEMKSAMAVPLFDEGRVLGILYADTTNPLHHYNDDYLRLLATFGNIIAARLSNYALLNERHEMEMMAAELRRASGIQKSLLVQSIPQLPGLGIHAFQEQCREVGGDLYDVALLPDGRMLFMVADVSGKGLGAALLMSNILASFRVLYNEPGFALCSAVSRVSRQLFCNSTPDNFATLFIGLINAESGRISYVNAGHNPPLLVRRNGSIESLEPTGIIIGAFNLDTWSESAVDLQEGDRLLVFTDGVTEAQGKDSQYSEQRLEQLVIRCRDMSAEELASSLMDDIETFVEDTPRSDDITMLILSRG